VDFFSSIRKTFTFSSKSKGEEFFRKLLFNFGQIIAKSDARTLARRVHLKTPLQIFSAGPVYQSYAGLGSAEISSEFDSLSSPTVNNNYTLITDYRVSCEGLFFFLSFLLKCLHLLTFLYLLSCVMAFCQENVFSPLLPFAEWLFERLGQRGLRHSPRGC
jgi:hypothetical protein